MMSSDETIFPKNRAQNPDHLAIQMEEMMENLGPLVSRECCIYRVPETIAYVNAKAYKPRLVSIGPFHHGLEKYKAMEEQKLHYLHAYLQRTNLSMAQCVQAVRNIEGEARSSYAEPIKLSSDDFAKMLLVDSCFIIELFLSAILGGQRNQDLVLRVPRLLGDLFHDLILLENQVPFFVLEKIYKHFHSKSPGFPTVLELTFAIFNDYNMQNKQLQPEFKIKHFTDLVRKLHIQYPQEEDDSSAIALPSQEEDDSSAIALPSQEEDDSSPIALSSAFSHSFPQQDRVEMMSAVPSGTFGKKKIVGMSAPSHSLPQQDKLLSASAPSHSFSQLDVVRKMSVPSHSFSQPDVVRKMSAPFHSFPQQDRVVDDLADIVLMSSSSSIQQKCTKNLKSLPGATELDAAGAKFEKDSSQCWLNIQFESDKKLKIPQLKIHDESESLIRNLVAFEQCHYPKHEHYLSHYFHCIKCLAKAPKDVDLLVQNGIIVNWLGNNEAVSNLLHSVCENIVITNFSEFYYSGLRDTLNAYCENPWNSCKASLKHDYFKTPWMTAATIAAMVLLLLTCVQTITSIMSVTK
ncbi:Protein of unknown function DUF247, plant [Dillenia turbinata]|uniref:Uncharacterized protein n=1 Tax=Dillenia turbinata TaxID=194707 RepID=A0AAN8UL44_9MAGN